MPLAQKIFSMFGFFSKRGREIVFLLFILNSFNFFLIACLINQVTGDTPHYLNLVNNMAENHFFGTLNANVFEPEGIRLFGYPFFILGCKILPGEINFNVVLAQGVLYLISVFLIWKLIKRNFGNQPAFIFLILLPGYPFIAYQSALIMPENVTLFLLTLTVFVLDFSFQRKFFNAGFLLAGFLFALTIYFRSNLLPLPFFLALVFLFMLKQNRKAVLLMPVAAILTIFPAVIYNFQIFNKLSPTPVFGGAQTSLWMATWHARVSTDSILRYRRGEITPEFAASGMTRQMAQINRKIGIEENFFPINMAYYADNATREKVQDEFGKAAIENISETPFLYLKSCFLNIFRMWFSAHLSFQSYPKLLEYYLLFIGFTVFVFGLAGMFFLLKNSLCRFQPFVFISATIIIFHSITLCWLHTEARYTIPARLFLAAFAAYGISVLFRKMRTFFYTFEKRAIDT